jgi:hypothetical protein
MNDFGIFKAIQDVINHQEDLSRRITTVVTEPRPGMKTPHMAVHFDKSEVDIPCFVQTAYLNCRLEIISTYHGDQEIHELMSRLNHLLDGAHVPVHIRAMDLPGLAVFKLVSQETVRTPKEGIRTGKLSYQIKVNIRRSSHG